MMRAVMADPLVSAYLFFDPSRLSELAHAPVCASTLRHKPGRSTSATLTCPDGMPWGWAQVLIGNQPEKLANVHRRAAAHGGTVAVHELAEVDGLVLLGRIGVDPRLHRGLGALASVLSDADPAAHRATDVDNAIAAGLLDVLRYNALRRLVLRGTDLGSGAARTARVPGDCRTTRSGPAGAARPRRPRRAGHLTHAPAPGFASSLDLAMGRRRRADPAQ